MMDEAVISAVAVMIALVLGEVILVVRDGGASQSSALFTDAFFLAVSSLNLLFKYFYFMYFISSPWRATPAQYALSLYVDARGGMRLLKSNVMRRIIAINLPMVVMVVTCGIATISDYVFVSYCMKVFVVLFVLLWVRPVMFGQSAYWDDMSGTSVYNGRAPAP